MTQPREDLPAARRRLDYAISALIDPKPHTITRDDGSTPIEWVDSLFDQLCDAVSGQTGERSGGQSTTPVWADAIDLADEITAQVREWHPSFPQPDVSTDTPVPTVIARLKALQAAKWTVEATGHVDEIAKTVEVFCEDIRRLLSGERVLFVYAAQGRDLAPCPQCGVSIVRRADRSGQTVRQPALQIRSEGNGTYVSHCVNCRAAWPSPDFLARLLGHDKLEGVLE